MSSPPPLASWAPLTRGRAHARHAPASTIRIPSRPAHRVTGSLRGLDLPLVADNFHRDVHPLIRQYVIPRACAPLALVLADARAPALLAPAPLALVRAHTASAASASPRLRRLRVLLLPTCAASSGTARCVLSPSSSPPPTAPPAAPLPPTPSSMALLPLFVPDSWPFSTAAQAITKRRYGQRRRG